jgi:predicted permease
VVAAGLFVRTFAALVSRPLGFERDRTLLVGIDSQRTHIVPAQRAQIYERLRQAVRAIPSVSDAALSMVTPIDSTLALVVRADIAGGATVSSGPMLQNSFTNVVSPGWFRTFAIPLVSGRDFTEADSADAARVAIVNETMARQFLGGESPIGRQLTLTLPGRRVSMDIVGVAADAVYSSPREVIPATVYTPIAQLILSPIVITSINLAVRTPAGSPEALSKAVTNAIGAVNPELSLTFRPIAAQVHASMRSERLMAELAAFFGVLALLLAALGLYGVIAAMVARRRRELGIRIALGATPSNIVRLVTARIAGLVTAGAVVGTLLSMWVSRFVATLLYGLEPQDPTTLGFALFLLALVAVAAGWWPAWQASTTDPADVLRTI